MKVSEYLPFYGLFFNFEYITAFEETPITVNELFEDQPDFELTGEHLDQLFYFDLASLQKVLEHDSFTPQNVLPYLRQLLDNYRTSGGNPFEWLQATFESVNLNPQNYRSDLITSIEKALIEWIETFKKQPIDYLYYTTNPEALPPVPIVKQTPESTNTEPLQSEGINKKEFIEHEFRELDKKGWEYAFRSESDYRKFTEIITNYFEGKPYSLPEKPLQLQMKCKTRLSKTLGQILNKLSDKQNKKDETGYFDLIRSTLNHFETKKNDQIYKDLTRG